MCFKRSNTPCQLTSQRYLKFSGRISDQGNRKDWDSRKGAKVAEVTGRGPSSRATRDLRKISPVGRNDNSLSLRAWRLGAITGCAMQVNFVVRRDQPIFANDDDAF